ncbi:C-type lectin domain family 4 member G-like isoform X2 [Mixophyes fleayi]|uniref:C-type lectin domain family 4 member G-like isoform X2 n=1 Tax=Mixophyes fleayi TaxID=3061075 RepID=UPI003F4E2CDC
MQNIYGNPKIEMTGCSVSDDDDDDDYENVSDIKSVPAVPSREKKQIETTGRREDLQLTDLAKPVNFKDTGNLRKNTEPRTVPTFQPPPIDAPSSEKNHKHGRLRLLLVVWMILMFLLFILLSSIMFIYYFNFSAQLSDVKQNVSLAQESTRKEIDIWKEDLKKVKQGNEIEALKTEIQAIKRFLGLCTLCPAEWTLLGSTCYFFSKSHQTWENSRKECIKFNSTLLILTSRKELDALRPVIGNKRFWIGLKKFSNKDWNWVDGTTPLFTNWNSGEPNNIGYREHCTEMITGGWNDLDCSQTIDYICKRLADC